MPDPKYVAIGKELAELAADYPTEFVTSLRAVLEQIRPALRTGVSTGPALRLQLYVNDRWVTFAAVRAVHEADNPPGAEG